MCKSEIISGEAQIRLMNPLTLAFVGDAVFELRVRSRIALECAGNIGALNNVKVRHVCCEAQAKLFDNIEFLLSEEEMLIYKRGRNAKVSTVPKKTAPVIYHKATGFEALIGFLYLSGRPERIEEFLNYVNL